MLGELAVLALAATLTQLRLERGAVVFQGGRPAGGMWIVQHGRVELSVDSGRRRTLVQVLRPGDVDGDIQLLLDMLMPYIAHVLDEATLLSLTAADFEHLLATSASVARAGCRASRGGSPPARTGCSASSAAP